MSATKMHLCTGQSVIEVLIAATALVFVLVGMVSGLTLAVRGSTYSNLQSLATQRAQEGIEVFRRFHVQYAWRPFYQTIAADGASFTYCLQSLPSTLATLTSMTAGACGATAYLSNTRFIREASITVVSASEISIVVTVRWQDGQETRQAEATQVFRQWN